MGVLNKDPTVWLDGAGSPTKYIWKYIKIVLLPNRISMIYSSAMKLFGNWSNLFYSERHLFSIQRIESTNLADWG